MDEEDFYIIFYTGLEKSLFNRYNPSLNLGNYSIALADIHFSKPDAIQDSLFITLDCLDPSVRYGNDHLRLLRLYTSDTRFGCLGYRRVLKAHCDTLAITFLDQQLKEVDIRKLGTEAYLTLHCRKNR